MSKLAGHQTARAVIEAMIAGERDPQALAALGRGKMRGEKLPALAEALTGMRFGPEHAHAAASLLAAIDLLEAELGSRQGRRHRAPGRDPRLLGRGRRRGHRAGRRTGPRMPPVLPAAARLDEIPGLGREAAAAADRRVG